jgi:O-acetylhomoserine (thiol)-lyase
MTQNEHTFGFRTRALHAGTPPNPLSGASTVPLELSTGFVFESIEQAKELFSLRGYGTIYSRMSNPTVAACEEKMANLEGGLGAVATSSGQAAQLIAVLSLAQAGDHLVASSQIYGGTVTQLSVSLRRMGIATAFVPGTPEAMRKAIRQNTKALFVETIGNPSGTVADLEGLAAVAHEAGVPLIVDNTFATPYLCRPIEHGADIVVHSATKYLCGHGTIVAGMLIESGRFDWGAGKHPLLSEPSPSYHGICFSETFDEYAFLTRARMEVMRDVGACLSPFNAWLLIQGLETLALRMEAHVANARRIAGFLQSHPGVTWVAYPELPGNPSYDLARRYLPRGAGGVVTFGVRGGRPAAEKFIEALELWSHLANMGDAKSLVLHPASTTHSQLRDEELAAAGITPDMVRLSVGLEDPEDLVWDLERALAAAQAGTSGATVAE